MSCACRPHVLRNGPTCLQELIDLDVSFTETLPSVSDDLDWVTLEQEFLCVPAHPKEMQQGFMSRVLPKTTSQNNGPRLPPTQMQTKKVVASSARSLFTKISWRRMSSAERSASEGRLKDEAALAGLPDGGGVAGSVASRNSVGSSSCGGDNARDRENSGSGGEASAGGGGVAAVGSSPDGRSSDATRWP